MRQKITCPESAHLEEIEYTENPIDGTILGVDRCSRFHPEGAVDCDGLCAKRLNQRFAIEIRGRDNSEQDTQETKLDE